MLTITAIKAQSISHALNLTNKNWNLTTKTSISTM